MKHKVSALTAASLIGLMLGISQAAAAAEPAAKGTDEIPVFQYDPDWPKQLPNAWITGNIGAITIDKNDHIWIVQRPASTVALGERDLLTGNGDCCTPAPPVIEFDQQGNVVQAWGAIHITDPQTKKEKLVGTQVSGPYPDDLWPSYEHGIYVDHKNNVWITNSFPPSQLLKFTRDGKFLLRIGKEEGKSNSDTQNLSGPAGIYVDPKTNEVFVADGYHNRRVIVFDADTGKYKRHWGAYGKKPAEDQTNNGDRNPDFKKRNEQFGLPHCIAASNDGLIYVCDRANSRVQVFKKNGSYVSEMFIAPRLTGLGTVFGIGFSGDREQRFLYVGDGSNKKIHILRRKDLKIVGSFGVGGRGGGQFLVIHTLTSDSRGNLYVGETIDNNRVQRFNFVGMQPASEK